VREGEWLVHLNPEGFAMTTLQNQAMSEGAPVLLTEGFVVFREIVAGCVPLPESPCDIELSRLYWRSSDFWQGDIRVKNLRWGFDRPIVASDLGGGITIRQAPSMCADIEGATRQASDVRSQHITVTLDLREEQLTLRGIFSGQFEFKATQLSIGAVMVDMTLRFELGVQGSGERPWVDGGAASQ
jgi:hypothetical protein